MGEYREVKVQEESEKESISSLYEASSASGLQNGKGEGHGRSVGNSASVGLLACVWVRPGVVLVNRINRKKSWTWEESEDKLEFPGTSAIFSHRI